MKARHHDLATRVDLGRATRVQVRSTATIFLPSTSTSALANSPLLGMLGSIVITAPPRMM